MKKTLYCLFTLLAVCMSFTACNDDIDWNRGTHSSSPAGAAQGTYGATDDANDTINGYWIEYGADGTTFMTRFPGTVTLSMPNVASGDNSYASYVVTNTTDSTMQASVNGDAVVNISWTNDTDMKFFNSIANGTLNTLLNGEIVNGQLNIKFSKTVHITARKTQTCFFQFHGIKK